MTRLTTFFFGITFLMVFFCSCTITKRRYNPGFHIEWKHSEGGTDDVKIHPIREQKKSTNTDTIYLLDQQVKAPLLIEVDTNKGSTADHQQALNNKIVKPDQPDQVRIFSAKRNNIHTIKQQEVNRLKKSSRSNIGWLVVGVLLMLLFVPPLFFTIERAGVDPTWTIVVFWVVWIIGILTIALLLSNIGVIIGLCLTWNVIFSIVGSFIG